ncbi:DUF4157 domain-containing protein [Streptomyces sp. NPDC057411]|uniref:eCIS core domain-containing protein n=1 Tax=unclassified Streptomyces TaxID=2593676 RepID=UPI003638DF06
MHDRDNARATGPRTTRAASGRTAPEAPLQRLLALQGTAGNAAVVQLLRQTGHAPAGREQHQHGAGCGHEPPAQVQRSAVHDVLRSGGQPLDSATRADMEARLGADFSDVRIHTDSAAKASAAEVGARAYTSGNHVVIGEGGGDRHTLAHELTHVIQQRQGPVAGTENGSGLKVSDPSDRFEREAEANATRAMSGAAPVQRVEDAEGSAAVGEPVVQRVFDPNGNRVDYDQNLWHGSGTRMEASLHHGQMPQGQAPEVKPAWWPDATNYQNRPNGDPDTARWFQNYMVQGHLLNHHLGGTGRSMENLTPLTKSANGNHHNASEFNLKRELSQPGMQAHYTVTPDYSQRVSGTELGAPPGVALDIDTNFADKIPYKLDCGVTVFNTTAGTSYGEEWVVWNKGPQ